MKQILNLFLWALAITFSYELIAPTKASAKKSTPAPKSIPKTTVKKSTPAPKITPKSKVLPAAPAQKNSSKSTQKPTPSVPTKLALPTTTIQPKTAVTPSTIPTIALQAQTTPTPQQTGAFFSTISCNRCSAYLEEKEAMLNSQASVKGSTTTKQGAGS